MLFLLIADVPAIMINGLIPEAYRIETYALFKLPMYFQVLESAIPGTFDEHNTTPIDSHIVIIVNWQ
ncbi:MAG: hypothetical protein PHV61_10700 [Limnochordia bacterium]|nr:hypothetical protein [Limnochordia bacterium]MDD2630610.1 hypothetical protein [Limnochordia bacterium]MDD4518087.1 hypothetical protein [Limnochordia bacterium]